MIKVTESRLFEQSMAVIIIMNSLALSLFDYSDRESKTKKN